MSQVSFLVQFFGRFDLDGKLTMLKTELEEAWNYLII